MEEETLIPITAAAVFLAQQLWPDDAEDLARYTLKALNLAAGPLTAAGAMRHVAEQEIGRNIEALLKLGTVRLIDPVTFRTTEDKVAALVDVAELGKMLQQFKHSTANLETDGVDRVTAQENGKPRVYWRTILDQHFTSIPTDAGQPLKAEQAIKFLKALNDNRIPNKGGNQELFWIDDVGTEQVTMKKTIQNALSELRAG
ncbi:MAG: hypothetical protein JO002_15930 [Burkholderiaceae bacterium]|nr:hypothetical protein [Burkholderiaceae bacterium]